MTSLNSETVNSFKDPSELPHHWALRRQFLLIHHDKFPEDRLICLSHVFVNIYCMGLTYPDEVTKLVNELAAVVDKTVIEQNKNYEPEDDEEEKKRKGK